MGKEEVATRILGKEYSPMIIRKSNRFGFPLYVGLICDNNLDDLDNVIHMGIDSAISFGFDPALSIQNLRNFTGYLTEYVLKHYDNVKKGSVEGCAVVFYADKTFISSLWGDFMTHTMCRLEFYQALNFMTQV